MASRRVLSPFQRQNILRYANDLQVRAQQVKDQVQKLVGTPAFYDALRASRPLFAEIRALYRTMGLPPVGHQMLALFYDALRRYGKRIPPGMEQHALGHLEQAYRAALDYIREAVK